MKLHKVFKSQLKIGEMIHFRVCEECRKPITGKVYKCERCDDKRLYECEGCGKLKFDSEVRCYIGPGIQCIECLPFPYQGDDIYKCSICSKEYLSSIECECLVKRQVDTIYSKLPGDLLCHILSFIPVNDGTV